MGTKEQYKEVYEAYEEDVHSYPVYSKDWLAAKRRLRLIEILHDFGLCPDVDSDYLEICADYRNHRYLWVVNNEDILSVFTIIGSIPELMDLDVKEALGDAINYTLSCERLVNIFHDSGVIYIYSEQYLGSSMLSGNEVAYLLKNMDGVIRFFRECVKGDEQLNGNILCQ